jgi:tetratricopeptide (TPR) repeat protein
MLDRYPSAAALDAIARSLGDGDPIVRTGALEALNRADPQLVYRLAFPLLRDGNRSVRIAAARALAGVPLSRVTPEARDAILEGVDDTILALRTNAERFEAQINIGVLYAQTGRPAAAEEAYRRAIELAPDEPSGYVNLADLFRAQGRDAEGEVLLRRAIEAAPDAATVHHAMGLLLIRRGRGAAAVDALGTAYELDRSNPRLSLAYALALKDRGDLAGGLQVLRDASRLSPTNTDILLAAVEVARGAGRLDEAREYAARLLELVPGDESIRALVRELER